MRPDRVFPAQRMDVVFRNFAEMILWQIASRRRDQPLDIFEMMLREAADPNRNRHRSHDILEDIPMAQTAQQGIYKDAAV